MRCMARWKEVNIAISATTESVSVKHPKDEKDCFTMTCSGFNADTLAAIDDAATGRNLSGPYTSVNEALAALDEE